MDILANPIISQVVSICVAAFCGYLASQMRGITAREKALHEGMKTLLRRELIGDYEQYVLRGEPLSIMRKDEIDRCYEAYKALGGNGTGAQMHEAICTVTVYSILEREDQS